MKHDARGMPMTGADAFSLARYETALNRFQSYVGDPIAAIDEALAASPAFVSGHLMKAAMLYTLAERQFVPLAAASLDAAKAHASSANERERMMIDAVERLVAGDWHRASQSLDRVLMHYPRDALALQVAHLMDFFRGDALNLRNRISRVLPHWDASVPGYSYVLGMHAFGLEEMNQYAEAEATARRALAMQPKDGWAVHAAVHVMEMQGRIDEGIDFLVSREPDWAPDNGFAFHNFWHLALFHVDGGRYDRALALYDASVHPEPAAYVLSLIDSTAMRWRLMLEGVDLGDRFERVADDWQKRLATEPGFYAFNDAHAAMAFAATHRNDALRELLARMRETAAGVGVNAGMTRDVGLPVAEGFAAFARGRYAEAVQALEPVRDHANRFGGSHAQRDILTLTIIEAALRSGDRARAMHYIAERLVHKPDSQWGPRLARRADALANPLPAAA
jgi:tetratricopeptide (TPR) repeat protein